LDASGFGGLTMSLEGGLELLPEFFFNRATSASNGAILPSNGATASAITLAHFVFREELRHAPFIPPHHPRAAIPL